MKKVILWIFGGIFFLFLALFLFVQFSWDKKFEAPYPKINVSQDSAVLARGQYLVYGPAHCATCHVPSERMAEIDEGKIVPLTGGWELSIPPGTFRAPNLTPDEETGIGKLTDEELARSLRHMVTAEGRSIFPFMEAQHMSDEDLGAIISYLRSLEPIRHEVPKSQLSFLGKALSAFGMLKPARPQRTPPVSVPKGITAEYGAYIANDVAACRGCHTQRDMTTGQYIGEEYAGGQYFEPNDMFKGYSFVSSNLTKDPKTGILANWSEETFVNRFRGGRIHQYSPMAWGSYSRMDEVELRAVYTYLESLKPVNNQIAKTVFLPGEKVSQ